MLRTALTDLLGINTPIVSPPMAGVSGGALAAQVVLAGGFGFIASGYESAEAFTRELDIARSTLSVPTGAPLPIGVGYLAWILDKRSDAAETLHAALEQRVKAIYFSFGADLGKWVEHVRQYDRKREVPHKTLVWVLVNSVAEARRAVDEWNVDVVVVQGLEAGGHGHGQALPLLTLLSLIQRELPNGPPLVAAGGLVTGAHVASLLVLGVAGAALGTRFVATHESLYSPTQKKVLLDATDTVRTAVFDQMRGTSGWPEGVDGRAVPNKTVQDEKEGLSLEERRKLYADAAKNDDTSRIVVWAGAGVGLINTTVGAGDLVRTLHSEIETHLSRVSAILVQH